MLYRREPRAWDGFPYDGFPVALPPRPVAIAEGVYDPSRVEDGLFYAGVFGYGALSPEQYAGLVRHVADHGLHDLFGWESPEAYLEEGNGLPFEQGRPADACPDPACVNHARPSSLRTFAIFEEEQAEVRQLWGPNCGGLQNIYQVCPTCSAIHASNQCT